MSKRTFLWPTVGRRSRPDGKQGPDGKQE